MITIKPIADRISIWLEKQMDFYKGGAEGMCVAGRISLEFKKKFLRRKK